MTIPSFSSPYRVLFLPVLIGLALPGHPGAAQPPPISAGTPIEVSKQRDEPKLDGACADAAYAATPEIRLLDSSSLAGARLRLAHSGRDFYACLTAIPVKAQSVLLSVDSDHSRRTAPAAAQYQFSLGVDGSLNASQGDGKGWSAGSANRLQARVSRSGSTVKDSARR